MSVGYARFVRSVLSTEEQDELTVVDELAERMRAHLEGSAAAITAVHVHGAQSSVVQAIVSTLLTEQLGFREEVVLTPETGFVTHARPDFFYRLRPGRGILAEVERGGTTNNNHDLKDLWKAHISPDAQHLFLIVPNANWTASGTPREKPFVRVSRRLAAFFGDPRRELDVLSLHLFGYGNLMLTE